MEKDTKQRWKSTFETTKIEVEGFSDFEIVLENLSRKKFKNEKRRKAIVKLLEKVFYIGFECGKRGKSKITIEKDLNETTL